MLQVSLHLNSHGEFVVSGQVSIPLAKAGMLGNVSLDFGFETVLNQVAGKSNYLIILWQDENGNIWQSDYSIGQPFKITFEYDQWVQRIESAGNGNIIVYVQKQAIPVSSAPREVANTPDAPVQNDTSCAGSLPSRLRVGMKAEVTTSGKAWQLSLRSSPDSNANQAHVIAAGRDMTILEGPVCAGQSYWWYIRSEQGFEGWAREGDAEDYWIDPLQ